MMRKIMFRSPCFVLAFTVAGLFCLASPGWAGLLHSSPSPRDGAALSRIEIEKELIISSLEKMGRERRAGLTNLSLLSDQEIHRLASSLEGVTAGGEEAEGKKALGVGIVILITLGLITGFYLFYQADK